MRCFSIKTFAFGNWRLVHAVFCSLPSLPASLFKPSRPTTTQEALQRPQTRRSFPSLIQPHFEAATASMEEGLLAYVVSLYVARRDKKDGSDDGRYSAVAGSVGAGELWVCTGNLNENVFLVFDAARVKIAVRWGVFLMTSGWALVEHEQVSSGAWYNSQGWTGFFRFNAIFCQCRVKRAYCVRSFGRCGSVDLCWGYGVVQDLERVL